MTELMKNAPAPSALLYDRKVANICRNEAKGKKMLFRSDNAFPILVTVS